MSALAPEPFSRSSTSPSSAVAELPGFLVDWRRDHRSLRDEDRIAAGQYIQAIVAREISTGRGEAESGRERALQLWQTFRQRYDDLRGRYSKTDAEDVRRALGYL